MLIFNIPHYICAYFQLQWAFKANTKQMRSLKFSRFTGSGRGHNLQTCFAQTFFPQN